MPESSQYSASKRARRAGCRRVRIPSSAAVQALLGDLPRNHSWHAVTARSQSSLLLFAAKFRDCGQLVFYRCKFRLLMRLAVRRGPTIDKGTICNRHACCLSPCFPPPELSLRETVNVACPNRKGRKNWIAWGVTTGRRLKRLRVPNPEHPRRYVASCISPIDWELL